MMNGDVRTAIAELREVTDEADAAHDFLFRWCGRVNLSHALACHGEADQARSTAEAAVEAAAQPGGYSEGYGYAALATAALAAGDVAAAAEASAAAASGWVLGRNSRCTTSIHWRRSHWPMVISPRHVSGRISPCRQ